MSDFINVLDYGAVGDDSTDNTQAFADAIAACEDANGEKRRIFIPSGWYRYRDFDLVGSINNDGFHVFGEPGTRLFCTKEQGHAMTIPGDHVTLEHIRIGVREARTPWDAGNNPSGNGLHFEDPDPNSQMAFRHMLRDVHVTDQPEDGIYFMRPELLYMEQCYVWNAGRYGFWLGTDVPYSTGGTGCTIVACRAHNCGSSGLKADQLKHSSFVHFQSLGCSKNDNASLVHLVDTQDVRLEQPDIEFNANALALLDERGRHNKIDGGILHDIQGIKLDDAEDGHIMEFRATVNMTGPRLMINNVSRYFIKVTLRDNNNDLDPSQLVQTGVNENNMLFINGEWRVT